MYTYVYLFFFYCIKNILQEHVSHGLSKEFDLFDICVRSSVKDDFATGVCVILRIVCV